MSLPAPGGQQNLDLDVNAMDLNPRSPPQRPMSNGPASFDMDMSLPAPRSHGQGRMFFSYMSQLHVSQMIASHFEA